MNPRFLAVAMLLLGAAMWFNRFPDPAPTRAQHPQLPAYFIPNYGQFPPQVAFAVQGRNNAAYFTPTAVYYSLAKPQPFRPASLQPPPIARVQLLFLDANPQPLIQPLARTETSVNYFKGPRHYWKTDLPAYSGVVYLDLWPGIHLEFSGPEGQLKYTFHVRPGADPRRIRFAYRGATSVSLSPSGSLHIDTPVGGFIDDKPVAWQDTPTGRQPVPVAFQLQDDQIQFQLGAFNPHLPLTIDPVVLIYAGYLGGSTYDSGNAIAIDSAGNAYVAGETLFDSSSFPVTVGPDLTPNGDYDAFVAKLNPAGTALLYAGFLGGSNTDYGLGIAVDSAGNVYLAGQTLSAQDTFPVTVGPDLTHNGSADAFVAKLNPTGNTLLYAGFLGGSGNDYGLSIAIDSAGNAYVAGQTSSTQATFPVLVGPDLTHNGSADAFVAKVNPSGTALIYSGYIGGWSTDSATAIAVDAAGYAYLAGHTDSDQSTFPVLVGPDLTHNGSADAFVAKVSPSGSALVYAGYIGGSSYDASWGIAVDPAGNVYLTGQTDSSQATFPVTIGPDLTHNGGTDAFIAKVNAAGNALLYAGYIGGSSTDVGKAVDVDPAGNAYVTGQTSSTQTTFPTAFGFDSTHNGSVDAFITKVNATGSLIVYSTYLGGSSSDAGSDIAVDSSGAAYLVGFTSSNQLTFPVTTGPDLSYNGSRDAFLARLSPFPSTAGPVMALRNAFNAIETGTFPSPALRNAGGNFRLNPALALSPSGRAFLIGRDSAVGVWLNTLNPDETYTGWLFAGGNSPGQPALTAAGDTAWIAIRDPWNSYSVRSYNPTTGFGSWTWLQGILATDPQIAACPNGDVYLTGRDNFNGVWTRRYSAATSSWQSWRFIGGIIIGTPAIACGADNAAYIAARDPSNNMWLARAFQESSATWYYGAGIFQGDLRIAAQGNLIHVFGLAAGVPWYRTWLVGTGWQGWTSPGGVLTHLAPAVYGSHVFLTGQDASGSLWWWSSLGNSWRNFGNKNVAPGSTFSAGAR